MAKLQKHNEDLTAQAIANDFARSQEREDYINSYNQAKDTITVLEAETVDLKATHEIEINEANELIKKLEGEKKGFKKYKTQKRDKLHIAKEKRAVLTSTMNSTDEDTTSEASQDFTKPARPLHQELNEADNKSESQEEQNLAAVASAAQKSRQPFAIGGRDDFFFSDLSDSGAKPQKSEKGAADEAVIAELLRAPRPTNYNRVRSASVASDFSGEATLQKKTRSRFLRTDAQRLVATEMPETFSDELIDTPEHRAASLKIWNSRRAIRAAQSLSEHIATQTETDRNSQEPIWSAMGPSVCEHADQATPTDAETLNSEMPAAEHTKLVNLTDLPAPGSEIPVTEHIDQVNLTDLPAPSSEMPITEHIDQVNLTDLPAPSSEMPITEHIDQVNLTDLPAPGSEIPATKHTDQVIQTESLTSSAEAPVIEHEGQTVQHKSVTTGPGLPVADSSDKTQQTDSTTARSEVPFIKSTDQTYQAETRPSLEAPHTKYADHNTPVKASELSENLPPLILDGQIVPGEVWMINPTAKKRSSRKSRKAKQVIATQDMATQGESSAIDLTTKKASASIPTDPVLNTVSTATQVDASMIDPRLIMKSAATQTEPVKAPTTLWTDIKSVCRFIFNHRILTLFFVLHYVVYVSVIFWCAWQVAMAGEERALWRRGNDTTRRASLLLQSHHKRREWLPWMTAARVDYLSTRRYGYGYGGGWGQYGVEY